jgi:hypothetical protein
MKTIILDSNFLMIPFQFKIDIISEINRICNFKYELKIIDKTIDELENLNKKEAKAALKLIENKKIRKIVTKKDKIVDDLILELTDKNIIVATQDKELKRKLKDKNTPIIVLRQKKYLKLENI